MTETVWAATEFKGYPPFPDVPVCYGWELPALPIPCRERIVREWQEKRCAVCGVYKANESDLFEDHDHNSGDTRGYLCIRCNTAEGQHWAPPVFEAYRRRYPMNMLGVLHRRKRNQHPIVEAADDDLSTAFGIVRVLTDPEVHRRDLADAARFRADGMNFPDPVLPEWTPLARALHRVGLTGVEYRRSLDERRAISMISRVCLPGPTNPPMTLCRSYPWTPPPRSGAARRPCPDCFKLDTETMKSMLGPDGYGPTLEAEREHQANMWRTARPPRSEAAKLPESVDLRTNAMRGVDL